ncbi:hypothetical protein IJX73_04480 [bacterium]|nr:hypothetical protein [bacterium]
MAIDFGKVANASIGAVQKITTQVATMPLAKLEMPNDSFGGKVFDEEGIQAIMKKFDLLIAQAKEHLEEATQKYNSTTPAAQNGKGRRAAYNEYKKAQTALKEITERKAKHEESPQLIQRFLEEDSKAPNTSFLYDPLLSFEEKKAILAQKPEIIRLHDLYKQHPTVKSVITSKKYFDEKAIGEGQIFIDLSNKLNAENVARLNGALPWSITKVAQETGMSPQDIRRYINSGFFEPVTLIDKQTGKEVAIRAIDWQSETTQAGLERLKKLYDLTPRTSKGVESLKSQGKPVLVPLDYLSKIGFGTTKEIEEALKNYKIPTRMIKSKDGMVAAIDIDTPKARGVLGFLETSNKKVCSVEQMAQRAKTNATVIEDAILSGEIVPIRECIGSGEKTIKINTATKKNQAFLDRMQFERELHRQENNSLTSLRSKLAWHFCPNTKTAASQAFAQNEELLKGIQKQIKELKDALADVNLKPEEVEELEIQLEKLTQQEEIATAKTYGLMWDIAGQDEYKAGMKRAQEIIKLIREQGIDAIEDEEVKIICQAHQG